MYGNHFYNETTRRYVAVFGTMFNDIKITRKDELLAKNKTMKVPINYAPMEKVLARVGQNLKNNAPAITLPRMSFEMTGMTYAPDRKLTSTTKLSKVTESGGTMSTRYAPSPYDIEFQLNIMTKYNEDGTKIIEQILPFFKPDCTVSVKLLDELDTYFDIPIVLNSVSQEDTYEGDFESRRALIWTLNFTMKGYFFGPAVTRKQITFIDADIYPVPELDGVQPGSQEGSQISVSSSAHVFSPFTFTTAENGDVSYTHNLVPDEQYRILRVGLGVGGPDALWNPDSPGQGTNADKWEAQWDKYLTGVSAGGGAQAAPDSTEDVDESDTWSVGDIFTAPDLDFLLTHSRFDQAYIDRYGDAPNNYNANSHQWTNQLSLEGFKRALEHALVTKVQVASYDPETATEVELGTDDDWKYRTIVT